MQAPTALNQSPPMCAISGLQDRSLALLLADLTTFLLLAFETITAVQ